MTEPEHDDYADSFDIAIVGMAARFPQARDVHEFWLNLCSGRCALTQLEVDEMRSRGVSERILNHPHHVAAGYLLEDYDRFDADFFGYSPREAELMDPQHRVLLECGWSALESAGHDPARYPGLTGVYAGASNNTYLMFNVARHSDVVDSVGDNQVMLGNSPDFLASRLSYKLGLGGPSITVQTACSTSLVAVALACQGLLAYQCDTALAGGVTADPLKHDGYLFEPEGLFSPDGLCRSFDVGAEGTAPGNGVGLVVLKRLGDAVADGDHIHAVIKGSAITNDGPRRAGFTAPSSESQARTIRAALAGGDVPAESVGFLEAHGSATKLGDPIEFSGLRAVFGRDGDGGPIALGSVKSNVGHLDAAAGVAGLIKATLAVEHGQVPPSLHFETPNPKVDLDGGPFFVNSDLIGWPRAEGPRRAGVSSFGLGGTNAHVVLEQAPDLTVAPEPGIPQLMIWSARTPAALDTATRNLQTHLGEHPATPLQDVAGTLALGRRSFEHRRFVVAADHGSAEEALADAGAGRAWTGFADPARRRPVAFMFTGFGDHYPGMGSGLFATESVFRDAVDRCAQLLHGQLDVDIRTVVAAPSAVGGEVDPVVGPDLRRMVLGLRPDQGRLDRPRYGHAAVFTFEYALAKLWRSWGIRPAAMIGHSLGEYVAACLAGVFSLEDALAMVVARANLIEAQGDGAMLAVPLPESAVSERLIDGVTLAAVNGPRSCVVAGRVADVEEFAERLRAEAVASRRLPGTAAVHSPLMAAVVEPYIEMLRGIRLNPPRSRFVSNVSGTWITPEAATDPAYWARHVVEPVRFADGIRTIWAMDSPMIVELGPGQTLCSAALQQAPEATTGERLVVPSLPDAYRGESDREVMLRALGRLWAAGAEVDWAGLHPRGSWRRTALPAYPFERQRYWLDAGPAPKPADAIRRDTAADWFYTASWQRLADPVQTAPVRPGEKWLIFADDSGLGEGLAGAVRKAGGSVTLVRAGRSDDGGEPLHVDPESADDFRRLVGQLRDHDQMPSRVVHCWGAAAVSAASDEAERDSGLALGFGSLVRWAQACEPELTAGPVRWDVVTAGAFGVLGEEPVDPVRAAVQGLCRVAPQEYPNLSIGQIDLDPRADVPTDPAAVERLLTELTAPPAEPMVARRGSLRWGPVYLPVPQTSPAAPNEGGPHLRERGVYLITGGLGKIGLVLAESLARSHRARLVLVGRTAQPDSADWDDPALPPDTRAVVERLRRIEAAGAELLVCAADVADADQLGTVLDQARKRFGRIDGVLHAAGTTGDNAHRVLADVTDEQARLQFRSKVHGTYRLHELLAGEQLDFALLFSSLSPLLGGLGFTTYAAANAVLDSFAEASGGRWRSVNWEGWQFDPETGDGPGPGKALNRFALTPAEGEMAFAHLLTAGLRANRVVISTSDLDRRVQLWQRSGEPPDGPVRRHPRPALGTDFAPPATDLEKRIGEVWQDLLGVDRVGVEDNFFELGGTSLLGVQVVHQLRRALGRPVPLTVVYQGPTIRLLAAILEAGQE